jgi:hypothetical protein
MAVNLDMNRFQPSADALWTEAVTGDVWLGYRKTQQRTDEYPPGPLRECSKVSNNHHSPHQKSPI